ncbi:hypothetical protein [Pseudomonas chlororaphis]|uniref:hypothetical protein n=1 Tax=Pseudomonas chlororaphis TaxID=587753 RepID=UPI00130D549E|nr:hypothetical protein [Pseudomonas chlororaphis]
MSYLISPFHHFPPLSSQDNEVPDSGQHWVKFAVELYEEPGLASFWGSVDYVEEAAYATVLTFFVDVVLHANSSPAVSGRRD